MNYRFIYAQEFQRIIYGVTLDSRNIIPALNDKSGFEVQDYIENIIATVGDNSLVYRIETDKGNLGGYFILQVNPEQKTCVLDSKQLRLAFVQFDNDISVKISNFIEQNTWQQDILF